MQRPINMNNDILFEMPCWLRECCIENFIDPVHYSLADQSPNTLYDDRETAATAWFEAAGRCCFTQFTFKDMRDTKLWLLTNPH